jgi:homoserine kinase type II
MTANISLNHADLEQISKLFGLGKLENATALAGGSSNSSYLVDHASEKLVVSVRDGMDFAEAEMMVQVLRTLEEHNLPTEQLLCSTRGKFLEEFNGRPLIIKRYIEGIAPENLDESNLRQVGSLLAKLHAVSPPPGLRKEHFYGVEVFDQAIQHPGSADYGCWLLGKKNYILQNLESSLPKGLIHGDLFGNNTIQLDGKTVGLIDFEESVHYYLIFDLGMTGAGACRKGGSIDLNLVRQLVQGYQQERKLEEAEKQLLLLFIEYAAVATSFWRYRRFHIQRPNPEKADRHKEMMALADHIHALDPEQFLKTVFG